MPESLSLATSATVGRVVKQEDIDPGRHRFQRRFLASCKIFIFWAKNCIVPEGTFGTDCRARRTEWCALMVYLSVWIPMYIIIICFLVVVFQSGWLEGMSVQTSYVNTLPAPSLVFCPPVIECGFRASHQNMVNGWSPPFHQYGINSSAIFNTESTLENTPVPHLLPAAALNLSFAKFHGTTHRVQPIDGDALHVCGCGQCVCLRSSRVVYPPLPASKNTSNSASSAASVTNSQRLFRVSGSGGLWFSKQKSQADVVRPVFESLQSETSHIRTQNQGKFTIRGYFLPRLPSSSQVSANQHCLPSTCDRIIRVGWYGENVPMSEDGLPERASWIMLPVNTSTQIFFRVNRIRLFEQGLSSIVTVMLHLWAPFLIQYRRFNPKMKNFYAEHHEYRLLVSQIPFPSTQSTFTEQTFSLLPFSGLQPKEEQNVVPAQQPFSVTLGETTLNIAVLTFFQQEQSRVGPVISLLAALGLAGVFLVLLHRSGAFFICFRRYEAQTPRLMVTSFLKHLSGGRIAENHIIGSFEAPGN